MRRVLSVCGQLRATGRGRNVVAKGSDELAVGVLKNFAMMFSFADVPMFLMVLMPKGRQTIHGIANEHITSGDDGTARAIRPGGLTRAG